MAGKAFFMMRLNDHVQYLKKIDLALKGQSDFQGTTHHECKLGKWLYGAGSTEIATMKNPKAKEVFESILEPHQHFHDLAQQVLHQKRSGDEAGVRVALTELYLLSTILTNKLLDLDRME